MCKITKMLSKILTVALVCIVSFDSGAMEVDEFPGVSSNVVHQQDLSITESIDTSAHKYSNVLYGLVSVPFLTLGLCSKDNMLQSIGCCGFLLFLMLSIVSNG